MDANKKTDNVRWITLFIGIFSLLGVIILAGISPNLAERFGQIPTSSGTPSYDIPFTHSEGFGPGVMVQKVSAHSTGTDIEFRIDYTSDLDRGMSFFNPPTADLISIQKHLPAGTGSLGVAASIHALEQVSNLTLNFYIPGKEVTGHIFLDFQAVKKILP